MKYTNIRLTDEEGPKGYGYRIKSDQGSLGVVYIAPTSNCQVFSIAGIQDILDCENAKEILEVICKIIGKTELLVDIQNIQVEEEDEDNEGEELDTRRYPEIFEEIFEEEDIIFKTPYKNNTGSDMIMYLVQTKKLK